MEKIKIRPSTVSHESRNQVKERSPQIEESYQWIQQSQQIKTTNPYNIYDNISTTKKIRSKLSKKVERSYSIQADSLASTFYGTQNNYTNTSFQNSPKFQSSNINFNNQITNNSSYNEQNINNILSVSTLRNSSPSYKFSQSIRFPEYKLQQTYKNKIDIPTTIKRRSTSFGFGKKTDIFPFKHIQKAQQTPAPNSHLTKRYLENQNQYKLKYPNQQLNNCINNKKFSFINHDELDKGDETKYTKQHKDLLVNNKSTTIEPGKSFGISFEFYRKTYLDYADKTIYSSTMQEGKPAPNAYDVSENIGSAKRKSSMLSRLKMFNEQFDKQIPTVTKYHIQQKAIIPSRYDDITFGFGQRIDLAKPLNNNPGPQYEVKRFLDQCNLINLSTNNTLLV